MDRLWAEESGAVPGGERIARRWIRPTRDQLTQIPSATSSEGFRAEERANQYRHGSLKSRNAREIKHPPSDGREPHEDVESGFG